MRRFLILALLLTSPASAQRVTRNQSYGPHRVQRYDLYSPSGLSGLRPAVLEIHGGAWISGSRTDWRDVEMAKRLAQRGFVCVNIDYTLGRPHGGPWWPQNVDDCRTALRYLRANAARLRIDPNRIAVLGESSGAHLAMMLAYCPQSPADRVQALVDMYGVGDLLSRVQVAPDGRPGHKFHDSNGRWMLGAGKEQSPALWRAASPALHIDAHSPPTLILHGQRDNVVPYSESLELDRRLTQYRVPHRLVLVPHGAHAFSFTRDDKRPLAYDLTDIVTTFLRANLAP